MIELILYIAIAGAICWFVDRYVPMHPAFKAALYLIVVIVLIIWVLNALGVTSIHPRFEG